MKSIILAAGYATRLYPLTLNKPKPLLEVKDKAIIEYSIEKINKIKEVDHIYIVTNTTFVTHFKDWASKHKAGKKISIIDDGIDNVDERRGSIGDILFSIENKNIKDDLIVVAGDNLFNSQLDGFKNFAVSHRPCVTIGLFNVGDKELSKRYGIAAIDKNAKIINFVEKPKDPPSTLAAMCLYFIPLEKLRLIYEYKEQGFSLDYAGNFIEWLSRKEPVYGYTFEGMWLDIGDEESLKFAQENYK